MTPGLVGFLVALAPIVVVLALLAFRVPSLWAGVLGLLVALIGSVSEFPLDGPHIAAAASGMAPTVVEIAVILLGGVGLAETMSRSGAQDRIAAWLESAERGADRTAPLFLLVFGLTPFMESVTGFGLGVVITAPLLIRFGLPPVKAVVSGLLGLVLVPWGSLAPGTLVAAELGGQDFGGLGVWSALLSLPVLVVSMTAVVGLNIGRPDLGQAALAVAVVLTQWGALLAANLLVGTPLAGVLAAGVVIAGLLGIRRLGSGPLPRVTRPLLLAGVPYFVIVGGILSATALSAATDARSELRWTASPALWLCIAVAAAVATAGLPASERWGLVWRGVRRWLPIAGNAIVFVILGVVMASTGMAGHLATTAQLSGAGFIAAIPAVGALGGYLTGTNMGAAAMLSAATTTAATGLGADPMIALAGQNVAGSFAIIASPPRIALAVGVALAPGERLPRQSTAPLLGAVAAAAVLLGVVVLALA
ncbi:L-lactate permease [Dietzia sp. ANT_WB102]|uniref:L-lactate permease n=1 Tax=Dietzia sp. ANT_WB102 TaxID=2597345 RepID=UPI0011EFB200|nr:L-lactate permease [Dietzia sp. ANT_WB102]KAA0919524.1 L-lactate permease [Dietzia sp. ANT_WB102]